MQPMTEARLRYWKRTIDKLDQVGCAMFQRFASVGHPIFVTPELTAYFNNRFEKLGGMTATISKRIGWKVPSNKRGGGVADGVCNESPLEKGETGGCSQ
jgi:hypothetical protein